MGQTPSFTSSGGSLVGYKDAKTGRCYFEGAPKELRRIHIVLNTEVVKEEISHQEQLEFSFTTEMYQVLSSDIVQYIFTFLPYKEETGTINYHVPMYFGKRNGDLIVIHPNISLKIVMETSWSYISSLLGYCRLVRVYYEHCNAVFNVIEKPQYKYLEQVKLIRGKHYFEHIELKSNDVRSLLFVLKNHNLDQKKMISKITDWNLMYTDTLNNLFLQILKLCPTLSTLNISNKAIGEALFNSIEYQQHSGLKEIRFHQTPNVPEINHNFLLNKHINSLHVERRNLNPQLIQDREWAKIKLIDLSRVDWVSLFQVNTKYFKISHSKDNNWLTNTMATWTTKPPEQLEKLSIYASHVDWNETHANGIRSCRNLKVLKIVNSTIEPEFLETLLKPLPEELPDGYCMQRKLIMVECNIHKRHLDELVDRFSEQNLWSIEILRCIY
jgi:hypothetical protein